MLIAIPVLPSVGEERVGADIGKITFKLTSTDFVTAPVPDASTVIVFKPAEAVLSTLRFRIESVPGAAAGTKLLRLKPPLIPTGNAGLNARLTLLL